MATIFISYRNDDRAVAEQIHRALSEQLGAQVAFIDSRSFGPGVDFAPEVWSRLRRSSAVLVLIGPTFLTSSDQQDRRIDDPNDYTRREVAFALRFGIPVIPVLVDDAPFPGRDELPDDLVALAAHQYIRIRSRSQGHDLAELADLLRERPREPERGPSREPIRGDSNTGGRVTNTSVTISGDGNVVSGSSNAVSGYSPPPGPEFPTDR